jgi:hypothetical protein
MTKILINCGDSWANGDYSWIDTTNLDYSITHIDQPITSYIAKLSNYIKIEEIVWLARGGESNSSQVYKLKDYLVNNIDYLSNNKVIVLFGTAPLSRLYLNNKIFYTQHMDMAFIKFQDKYLPLYFELQKLELELLFIHSYLKLLNIDFYVYNTYNTYKLNIPNLLFKGSSLFSLLISENNEQNLSIFDNIPFSKKLSKNNYIKKAINLGYLDYKTKHPSLQGSIKITELLIEELKNILINMTIVTY